MSPETARGEVPRRRVVKRADLRLLQAHSPDIAQAGGSARKDGLSGRKRLVAEDLDRAGVGLEGEQRDFRARTAVNLRAGNKELAAQYALRLQTVPRELAENRAHEAP